MILYAFLQYIHAKFLKAYGDWDVDSKDEFSRVLNEQMDYYSNNPNTNTIYSVLTQMDEFRHVILENIEKKLERGEKLEVLVRKTQCIHDQNFKFEKKEWCFKRNRQFWEARMSF